MDTTELTPSLVTPLFTFILFGRPPFVPLANGREALQLTGTQYFTLQPKDKLATTCTEDISQCKNGITISLRLRFTRLYDNTYVFSNGGYSSTTDGVSMLYRFGQLHVFARLRNKHWYVSHRVPNLVGRWTIIYVSWQETKGLSLYVDKRLAVETATHVEDVPPAPNSKTKSVFFFGGYKNVDSPYAECLLHLFKVQTVHILILIENHLISVEGLFSFYMFNFLSITVKLILSSIGTL